ncbi:superoxide dismutase family protein [Mycolicibacterium tusciae]|uniref:Superoxide dismutase n=1 Tax=Mycolicibacterium tusciae TaxID=75922 RepID=A0A1X0JHX3_9MYCO|nr:superoxide dismutase family protein [Mycolicibacterium tusciae]ORB62364.1 superoxide dismutase [Mycolicibacterium tusciae]
MIKHATAAIALFAAPVTILSGCANESSDNASTTTTSGSASGAQTLTTQLKTTDGEPVADATIDFTSGYATVTVETVGTGILSPGLHGLHIHAVGTCDGDFTSAGGHFQAPGRTGEPASGDLPPLLVRSDGAGKLVATSDGFTEDQLKGPDGSAILLHQDATSDQRIACGVLSPASTTSTSVSTSTSTVTTTASPAVPPATVTETTTPAPAESTTSVVPGTSTSTVTVIQPPTIPDITVPPLPGPGGG